MTNQSFLTGTILAVSAVFAASALVFGASGPARVDPNLSWFRNDSGQAQTFNSRGILNPDNPFFKSLGTNGRACVTCHAAEDGWTITPASVRRRFASTDGLDPIFRNNDGSNCEGADVSTRAAREKAFSLLLSRGLIRIGIDVPTDAEFTIESVDDPYACGTALASASLYRRPLPATNLRFLSTVMWDGRGSAPDRSIADDLISQARDATLDHAQALLSPTDLQLQQIVDFEAGLYSAQAFDNEAGLLSANRATGGPVALSRVPFYIGINDPLGQNPTGAAFDPNAFTIFGAWSTLRGNDTVTAAHQAVARGQAIFNTRTFDIEEVAGLTDELHVTSIRGTCTTCHDTPNVGNHSVKAPLNIGLTDPARRTADLPLYTLRNLQTGEVKLTTDPGRAMMTGRWNDVGKFKGPILRGLASRAPYFHNGFAATLADVVDFYDTRFVIGLRAREKADLIAFLSAL